MKNILLVLFIIGAMSGCNREHIPEQPLGDKEPFLFFKYFPSVIAKEDGNFYKYYTVWGHGCFGGVLHKKTSIEPSYDMYDPVLVNGSQVQCKLPVKKIKPENYPPEGVSLTESEWINW